MIDNVVAVTMPKWGLTMEEGTVLEWLIDEGELLAPGDDLVEIETSKIVNVVEVPDIGILRRIIAVAGDTLPVGALLAVITAETVEDAEIDAFVADFNESFIPSESSNTAETMAPQFANIGSQKIFYTMAGSEDSGTTPVVFIHGYGGDSNNWLFNIDAIATDHTTFAIDLPGHGRSSKSIGDGSISMLADVVAGFLSFIEAEAVHLVGHSLGAAVACELASTNPGLVKSLTLLAPAGLSDTINSEFLSVFATANSRRELKPAMESLFADETLVTRSLLNETLKSLRIDGVREALQAIEKSCFAEGRQINRYDDFINGTDIPTLIIVGDKDDIVPAPESSELLNSKVIPGVGHMLQLEAAAEVNRMITDHLSH
jgi:pyruvate dehydrogenase E2 component (dihydrolipoamide acetyltransferase)